MISGRLGVPTHGIVKGEVGKGARRAECGDKERKHCGEVIGRRVRGSGDTIG
jgi:hypothetical protein